MERFLTFFAGLLISSALFSTNEKQLSFYHISVDDGLSHLSANDTFIDSLGIAWIATVDGLNCYNGNSIKVFRHPAEGSNLFTKIVSDGQDRLYLLRSDGVSCFDCRKQTMTPIVNDHVGAICYEGNLLLGIGNTVYCYHTSDNSIYPVISLENDTISSIKQDENTLFIGTRSNGLYCFINNKEVFHLLSPYRITHIYKDSRDRIWASTWNNGLFLIENGTVIKNYTKDNGIPSNFVRTCCEDSESRFWVGTISGLSCIDSTGISNYKVDQDNPFGLSDNSIWGICRDRQGNIWISTYYGGVNYFNPSYEPFARMFQSKQEGDGLSNPIVGMMEEDSKGNLWIATECGLTYLDRTSNKTKWHCKEIEHIKALYLEENLHRIWIASDMGGLFCYNYKKREARAFQHNPKDPSSIPNNRITDIISYDNDSLLLATHSGLCIFSTKTGTGRKFNEAFIPGNGNHLVTDIMKDGLGNIWIVTTEDGLCKFDPKTTQTKHYELGLRSSRNINSIKQDSLGNIWICTSDSGLFLYQQATDSFLNFSAEQYGFSSNRLYCADRLPVSGNLILTSGTGFTIFDITGKNAQNYGVKNGLPFSSAYEKALHITKDGTIYIGSTHGFVSFDERKLKSHPANAEIILASLTVNGEEIQPGDERGLLKEAEQYTKSLSIGPEISQFALNFSVTNHIVSDEIDLEYQLKGLSDSWTPLSGNKQISFTKLTPGKYNLLVRSINKYNKECLPFCLKITVRPPWYKKPYAIVLWILILCTILYYVLKTYNSRMRLTESLKYERKKRADIEEMNRSKLNFYAGVSQEISTPLTIILSQAESIMQKQVFIPEVWNKLISVYKNSLRLKDLSDELLTFRKQEAGELKIHVMPHNFAFFVGEFSQLFKEYANTRGITLTYEKGSDSLEVWYDEKQIQTVMSTLLANSFRHTKAGDSIVIKVYCEGASAILEVIDNGYGIPEKDLQNIFSPFHKQEDGNVSRIGIGFALTKGIIEMHHGSFKVSSKSDEGARFKVSLPLGYAHFSQDQLARNEELQSEEPETGEAEDEYFTEPFNNRLLLSQWKNKEKSKNAVKEGLLPADIKDKDILKKATQIIEEYISDSDFDVEKFATALGVSRTVLFAKIKEVSGESPNNFILSIRLKRAAFLLKNYPDISVAQISEETGFGSARYFSQKFKLVYKTSPLRYRKKA